MTTVRLNIFFQIVRIKKFARYLAYLRIKERESNKTFPSVILCSPAGGGGREGMSPHWHGDSSSGGSGPGAGSFRPPPPDMRGLRPSDAPHFRPQLRGPPPAHPWPIKDGRERFSSPQMRGGPQHRGEPNRHMRFFSRWFMFAYRF